MERKKRNGLIISLLGATVSAIVLVGGTFLTGRSASQDTEKAVRNVSLFYLDELATRREQVVAAALSDYISDLDIALRLMEKDDLSSTENLQRYQAKMKQLYGLEKFAFVDTEGLIYTSQGTRTDISLYDFDYTTLSAPEISIKNQHTEHKKLIIAVPVDRLPFNGKMLVVCFMEIDMARMLNGISLSAQSEVNNTTFCNIYTANGFSLSNTVLGGLAGEDNLYIFISEGDAGRLTSLIERTGFPLQVSDTSFIGGIQARIPERNILIDDSFQGALETLRREFVLKGGD